MRKNSILTILSFFIISVSIFALNKIDSKKEDTKTSIHSILNIEDTPPPAATISGTTQVCLNDTQPQITFTGSGGTSPYTFTYTINSGGNQTVISSGNTANVNVNTNSSGVFVYELISVRDSTNDITNENGSATVTVGEPPAVDFSFDNVGACSGTSVNFTPNVTGTSPFTYSWNFGDGNTSTSSNPSHIFTSLGCGFQNFSVTLTVTDDNGCSNSFTRTISVQQKPLLEFIDTDSQFDPFNNCGNNTTDPSYTINVGMLIGEMVVQ